MLARREGLGVNSLRNPASDKVPPAMADDVIYERLGAAAVLTIDRQERRNAPTTRRACW